MAEIKFRRHWAFPQIIAATFFSPQQNAGARGAGIEINRNGPSLFDIEGNALRQRQRLGVVDGVGRAAHIGLPGIRTGFTSTPGFLLTAECAADFSTRGTDIDIGDAAIRAFRRQEPLGLLNVASEDRGGKSGGDSIMRVDRLVEIAVLHDVEDRGERLFQNGANLLGHFNQCWFYVIGICRTRIHAVAAVYRATGRLGGLERLLHAVKGRLVDQRADECGTFQRIADGDGGIGFLQTRHQLVIDAVMHEKAAKRGAALAGRAHGAKGDGAQRHVEIGRRADDAGIVAAEFQNGAGEALCQARADITAHAGGAGGRDERYLWMIDQRLANSAVTDQQLGQAFRRIAKAGRGALENALNGKSRERGLLRRLPDNRVTTDEGKCGIPRPDGNGEVEGRDDADDTQRMPGLHHPVAGPFGGDGETIKLAGQTDGEIADIDHFLHFTETFGRDFARFQRNETAKIGLEGAQFFAQQADQFAAAGRRHVAPGPESRIALFDHSSDAFDRHGFEARDLLTRDGAEGRHVATGIEIAVNAHPVEQGRSFLFHVELRHRIHVHHPFG
ncbi:Hypothetical protein AT6N2_L0496 [Agrobacterium tumefaciens]|nr:Hypothetical protein AT6N2_L0496 [Agrobacterium tumefaciens]